MLGSQHPRPRSGFQPRSPGGVSACPRRRLRHRRRRWCPLSSPRSGACRCPPECVPPPSRRKGAISRRVRKSYPPKATLPEGSPPVRRYAAVLTAGPQRIRLPALARLHSLSPIWSIPAWHLSAKQEVVVKSELTSSLGPVATRPGRGSHSATWVPPVSFRAPIGLLFPARLDPRLSVAAAPSPPTRCPAAPPCTFLLGPPSTPAERMVE